MRLFSILEAWFASKSPFQKAILALATTAFLVELALRTFAPKSRVYAAWTRGFETVGGFWSGIILSFVYFIPVFLVSLGMRLRGQDPLDRAWTQEPSFWRSHEPNPLGPESAARHQF